MSKWITIEEGFTDIQPRYKGDTIRDHILPGTFPFRYWLIGEMEEDEVEGLPNLVKVPSSQVSVHIDEEARPRCARCKRCQREIQPQYTYCYRCNNYLKVKARIQAA